MRYYISIIFLLVYTLCVSSLSALQCWTYNDNTTHNDLVITRNNEKYADQDRISTCNVTDVTEGCFVLWKNNTNGTRSVISKGCFISSGASECKGQDRCVDTSLERPQNLLFCCCLTDLCNENFHWEPTPTPPTTDATNVEKEESITFYAVYVVFIVSMLILVLIMYLLKKRKTSYFNEISNIDQRSQSLPSTPRNEKLRPIQLEEVRARGKFGAVWRATDKNEIVAVKIMSTNDRQAWLTEQEVFKLPGMNHENILRFIAAEKRGENSRVEFWIITAYHPLGSLHDFLKNNTITWEQFLIIGYTMARGLVHLHEEILPEKGGDGYKPAIAHRDFKSSNVLLKSDLTACIADFGLALIFKPHRACGDTHGQVGTRRYMAPEVLEGAINFSRDSFLRIDMYAVGLVLWELASRCNFQQGPVLDYKLPFEEEVGLHPSLEDMQEIVVQQKRRPIIKTNWLQHPGFVSLQTSIEECWDHDSEARVSASCIMERFLESIKLSDSPNTPLLFNNNLTTNTTVNTNNDGNPFIAV